MNGYLREVTAESFTARTFRTWGGSVHALRHLLVEGPADSATAAKRQLSSAVKSTATELLTPSETDLLNLLIPPRHHRSD